MYIDDPQLNSIAGADLLEHHFLSTEEITNRGYSSEHVKKAAIFPRDGNFPPYLDEEFENLIQDNGGFFFIFHRLEEWTDGWKKN